MAYQYDINSMNLNPTSSSQYNSQYNLGTSNPFGYGGSLDSLTGNEYQSQGFRNNYQNRYYNGANGLNSGYSAQNGSVNALPGRNIATGERTSIGGSQSQSYGAQISRFQASSQSSNGLISSGNYLNGQNGYNSSHGDYSADINKNNSSQYNSVNRQSLPYYTNNRTQGSQNITGIQNSQSSFSNQNNQIAQQNGQSNSLNQSYQSSYSSNGANDLLGQTPYISQYRSQIHNTPLSQPKLTKSALISDQSSTLGESKTLLENFNNTRQNRPQPSLQFSSSQNLSPKGLKSTSEVKRAHSSLRSSGTISASKRSSTPSLRPGSGTRTGRIAGRASSNGRFGSTNLQLNSSNKQFDTKTESKLNGTNKTLNGSTNFETSTLLASKSFQTLHEHAESMKRDLSTQKLQQARSAAEKEYLLGMEEYDNLHFEEALKHFQKSLSLVETSQDNDYSTPGDHVEVLANIFLGMGIVYYALGRDKAALELYNRCVECLKERFGNEYPGMVSALVNIGLIYMNQKKYNEALVTLLKAQKLAENVLGMDRLGLADIYHNVGVIYDSQGKLSDALNYYKRSLRIREKLSGEHPITALTYENMAMIYKDQKQFNEALELQNKVLDIRKNYFGTENSDFALALFNLGKIYKEQGKLKKALTYIQKAHKIRNQEFGQNHELTLESLQALNNVKSKLEQQVKRKQSMYTL